MEQVVKALNKLMETLEKGLREQTKKLFDALAPLKKLPELIQSQMTTMVQGFSDTVKSHVLVAIAQQKGVIGAKEHQIKEELGIINQIRDRCEKSISRIRERNQSTIEKIRKSAADTVTQMDGPVFDLAERYFTESVFKPYSEHVVPDWQLLANAGEGSGNCRNIIFETNLREVIDRLENYIAELEDLQKRASELAHPGDIPDDMVVPVCLVEYGDETQTERQFWFAPVRNASAEDQVSSGLIWLEDEVTDLPDTFTESMQTVRLKQSRFGPSDIARFVDSTLIDP